MENQPPLPPAIVPPSQDGSRPDTKQSTLTTGRKMIAQREKIPVLKIVANLDHQKLLLQC